MAVMTFFCPASIMQAVASTSQLEDTDALLAARLLTDERAFRTAALRSLPLFDLSSTQSTPTADELGLHTARYITALESINLNLHKGKARAIQDAAAQDAAAYDEGIARIEAERAATSQAIVNLRAQLADAQTRRKNKIEYDALAKEIGKVPTREDSRGHIERLTNEIQTLIGEQSNYTETWSARKTAYDQIVASLEALTKTIKDEKAEADRRNALDEDADAEAGEEGQRQADPNAAGKAARTAAGEEGESMDVDERPAVVNGAAQADTSMVEKEEGEMD